MTRTSIASWNINSVRARIGIVEKFLREEAPDILCLQETNVECGTFPPEMFRALTDGGATAFLVASGWPTLRIEHWDVLTRARAIENQAWVLACNAAMG